MVKVYELTTNGDDGYAKYYVRGVVSDAQARKLAKMVFQNYYWDSGISYYDDYPSKYGHNWEKEALTIDQFLKLKKRFN